MPEDRLGDDAGLACGGVDRPLVEVGSYQRLGQVCMSLPVPVESVLLALRVARWSRRSITSVLAVSLTDRTGSSNESS